MEADARNEPLLPRSASFGDSRSMLTSHASRVAATAARMCEGDESAVYSACVAGSLGCLTIGLLGILNC